MFGDALTFPLRGDDGLRSLVIGGILSFPLVAVFLLPVLPVLGYYVRAAKAGVRGEADAPAFDDWEELFVDGVKLLLVTVAYFLVPVIAFVAVLFATGLGAAVTVESRSPEFVESALGVAGLVGGGISLLLFLVAAYVFPAAVVNFAHRGDVGAAFELRRVFAVAFSVEYFLAGVLGVLLTMVVTVLSFVLGLFTLGVFFLLSTFVQFYVRVGVFYLFGRGYAKALDLDGDGRTRPVNNRV